MKKALEYFSRLIDSTDKRASLRLVCFALVVIAAVVWLSIDLRRGIGPCWVEAFGLLLAAVTGAKLIRAKIQGGGKGESE